LKPGTQEILELTETRARILGALAQELHGSFGALTRLDIPAIQEHTQRQRVLVEQIRGLDRKAARLRTEVGEIEPEAALTLRAVAAGVVRVQSEVRRLNHVQAELLKGWRRSINLLLSLAGIYPIPSAQLGRAAIEVRR